MHLHRHFPSGCDYSSVGAGTRCIMVALESFDGRQSETIVRYRLGLVAAEGQEGGRRRREMKEKGEKSKEEEEREMEYGR